MRASRTAGQRHERGRALERLHRLVRLPGLAQRGAERHLHREAARAGVGNRLHRRQRELEELLDALGYHHRAAHRAEHPLDRLIEAGLHLIEVGVERGLERLIGVDPLRVGAHELVQCGIAIRVDDVLDQQGGLVVRKRDRLRTRKRGVEIAQLQRLAAVQHAGEGDVHLATPLGARLFLLVDGDAFGEPARDPLVRHLQRDDVRELVPHRRFPLELAARPGIGRVHDDDAAETDAQRADHARQAERADGEVVLLRKDLDQDRPARRELVARRERAERLVRERHRILAQDRRLVRVEPHHNVAVADRDVLVDLVHHVQLVLGDPVERIRLECRLERDARARLVAGAEEVRAEVGLRAEVARVERQGPARQLDRFVEPVVARGQIARHAIDLAVPRRDRQRFGGFGLEILRLVFDVGERRAQRDRVEARRVHDQCLVERLPRLVVLVGVGRFLREENLRVDR